MSLYKQLVMLSAIVTCLPFLFVIRNTSMQEKVIAISGNTGMSTGPHLHLTTKKDGKVIDPAILLNYVKGMITPSCI